MDEWVTLVLGMFPHHDPRDVRADLNHTNVSALFPLKYLFLSVQLYMQTCARYVNLLPTALECIRAGS